jgi:hypothetical protein
MVKRASDGMIIRYGEGGAQARRQRAHQVHVLAQRLPRLLRQGRQAPPQRRGRSHLRRDLRQRRQGLCSPRRLRNRRQAQADARRASRPSRSTYQFKSVSAVEFRRRASHLLRQLPRRAGRDPRSSTGRSPPRPSPASSSPSTLRSASSSSAPSSSSTRARI